MGNTWGRLFSNPKLSLKIVLSGGVELFTFLGILEGQGYVVMNADWWNTAAVIIYPSLCKTRCWVILKADPRSNRYGLS